MHKIFFMVLISVLVVTEMQGQEEESEVANNGQIWLDFNGKHTINETQSATGFLGYRTISPRIFDKFMVFGTYDFLHTKSPKFMKLKKPLIHSFHLGGGLYWTDNKAERNDFEFRTVQGMKFYFPNFETLPVQHYLRLEQRFQKTFDGTPWDASMRFRYRISTIIEWKKHFFSFNEGMYIPASVEFFYNFQEAKRFNDVIRVSPGLGYKFSDEWRMEFYVSYHLTQNTTAEDDSTNDIVFRLRVFNTTSSLKKKKKPQLEGKKEDLMEMIE